MHRKSVIVGSTIGRHARPAALIARTAASFDDEINIAFDGAHVDASSSLLIMTLGAEHGAEVTVESANAEAVETIASMIEQDLDA